MDLLAGTDCFCVKTTCGGWGGKQKTPLQLPVLVKEVKRKLRGRGSDDSQPGSELVMIHRSGCGDS
jgi:hypothetical protein